MGTSQTLTTHSWFLHPKFQQVVLYIPVFFSKLWLYSNLPLLWVTQGFSTCCVNLIQLSYFYGTESFLRYPNSSFLACRFQCFFYDPSRHPVISSFLLQTYSPCPSLLDWIITSFVLANFCAYTKTALGFFSENNTCFDSINNNNNNNNNSEHRFKYSASFIGFCEY